MTLAILNVNHGWHDLRSRSLAALGVGLLVGLINGALVVLLDIDSLIVDARHRTFIAGVICCGSATPRRSAASPTRWSTRSSSTVSSGSRSSSTTASRWWLVIWYVFEFTPVGRRLLFVGRGRSVARLSGIRVARLRWGCARRLRPDQPFAGSALRRHDRLGRSHLGAELPAAGLRRGVPRRDDDHARALQPDRLDLAVYFLVTGITGLQLLGVRVRPAALLRRRAGPRGRTDPSCGAASERLGLTRLRRLSGPVPLTRPVRRGRGRFRFPLTEPMEAA